MVASVTHRPYLHRTTNRVFPIGTQSPMRAHNQSTWASETEDVCGKEEPPRKPVSPLPTPLPKNLSIRVVLRKVLQPLRSMTLGAFKRQSQSSVPVKLAQSTHGPRYTKQDSVVLVLSEAVMPEKGSRMGINVGVRIGHLSMFRQNS